MNRFYNCHYAMQLVQVMNTFLYYIPISFPSKRLGHIAVFFITVFQAVYAQGTWEATLRGRDLDGDMSTFEAWYDTSLNVTWIADAYLIKTTGYDTDDSITWDEAVTWINYLNQNNYLGYNGWRLPTLIPINGSAFAYNTTYNGSTDRSYNVSAPGTIYAGSKNSELAYMFYNTLGNVAYYDTSGNPDQSGYGLSNSGPFLNLQETGYWTDIVYALVPNGAWQFRFDTGFQDPDPTFANIYKPWPVHDGDVGNPPQGDINMNGRIDAGDVYLAQACLVGVKTLSFQQLAHADVYPAAGDGQLTLSDLAAIIKNTYSK